MMTNSGFAVIKSAKHGYTIICLLELMARLFLDARNLEALLPTPGILLLFGLN